MRFYISQSMQGQGHVRLEVASARPNRIGDRNIYSVQVPVVGGNKKLLYKLLNEKLPTYVQTFYVYHCQIYFSQKHPKYDD